jgi:hypothetical protein
MISKIQVSRIDWHGITVEIRYEPSWSPAMDSCYGRSMAHIELHVIDPACAKLPVTDTGYRSHFIPNDIVIEAGGAIHYVRAWLDDEAQTPAWKDAQEAARQFALF